MTATREKRSRAGTDRKYWLGAVILFTFLCAWLPLGPTLIPMVSTEGFAGLAETRIQTLFIRTLWLSTCAAGIAMVLGAPLALLSTRARLPGGSLIRVVLPLPLFLPPLLVGQAWHGLLGIDGKWAAVFTLGACYAPFPAILVARALSKQSASTYEAALLAGGRRLAIGEMIRTAVPAALFGGALAFLFSSTDFAVPDYFAAVGEKFTVYSFEVFNGFRDSEFARGAQAATPLVAASAVVFYICLHARDAWSRPDMVANRTPAPLALGSWSIPCMFWCLCGAAVLFFLPLGRIFYETGLVGAAKQVTWAEQSTAAFQDALNRGRADLLRSIRTGLLAGAFVLIAAPVWAHALIGLRQGFRTRGLSLLLALPLLAPAVGFALGAIVIFNRDLFGRFYESYWLPPVLMAGRYLPIAVFLLAERMQRVPVQQEEAARLIGAPYWQRLFRYRLGPQIGALLLAVGLVAVFAVRELDLAVPIPAANPSAAVRYYNALHFARDNFVMAFGLLIAIVLFLPVALLALVQSLRKKEEA